MKTACKNSTFTRNGSVANWRFSLCAPARASTMSPGFALQGLKRPGLVSRLSASSLAVRCALARGAALLMALAYTAIGQWAVRDVCCDCFVVLDLESKIDLSSRSAERRRCRLARRGQYARDVRQRPTRDRMRTARRSQRCRGKTADAARLAGDPARATPTAEDASPGPPGRRVVRPCFVCHVRPVRVLIRDMYLTTCARHGSQIRSNAVTRGSRAR